MVVLAGHEALRGGAGWHEPRQCLVGACRWGWGGVHARRRRDGVMNGQTVHPEQFRAIWVYCLCPWERDKPSLLDKGLAVG
jgi:hypothetical protein